MNSGRRNSSPFWRCVLGLVLLVFSLKGWSLARLEVASFPARLLVTSHAEILEDPGHALTVEQARYATTWRPTTRQALNFGISKSVWWVRIRLNNGSDLSQSLVLDLGATQQDRVDWFLLTDKGLDPKGTGKIGDFLDFRQRPLQTRTLAVPVHLEARQWGDLYLRFQTQGTPNAIMPLTLARYEDFLRYVMFEDLLISVFHGMLLSLIVFSLLLYVGFRHPAVGLYALYLVMFLAYSLGHRGFDLQYVWNDSPLWHHRMMVSAAMVCFVAGNGFVMVFMRIERLIPRWLFRVLLAGMLINLADLVVIALDHFAVGMVWGSITGVALTSLVWVILGRLSFQRVPNALPVFLAFTGMVITLFLYNMQLYGLLPGYWQVLWGIQVATLIGLVVVGILLARLARQESTAKALEAARQAMVRYVSHDLRAPQSAILALLDGADAAGMAPPLRQGIAQQVDRTLRLTDAFLWLSRAESTLYRFEEVFLGELAYQAIDQVWPLAQRKGIRIERSGLDDERCQVSVDHELLTRAIYNLLENAVKYSGNDSTIRVTLRLERREVVLSVQDEGVGVAEDGMAKLFEDYQRGDQTRGELGHGLGLAFVAAVIEAHHARIDCRSVVGAGTTFTVKFRQSESGRSGLPAPA